MFSVSQQQAAEGHRCKSQEDPDHVLPSCCFGFFLVDSCCQSYFLPARGPRSAHKRHCLRGLLTASQESIWCMGPALTAPPRRPIHRHRLRSTHTLSDSQRHSQCRSEGSSWSRAELDQIPQQPLRWALSLHSSVIYAPLMGNIMMKYHFSWYFPPLSASRWN